MRDVPPDLLEERDDSQFRDVYFQPTTIFLADDKTCYEHCASQSDQVQTRQRLELRQVFKTGNFRESQRTGPETENRHRALSPAGKCRRSSLLVCGCNVHHQDSASCLYGLHGHGE